MMSEDTLTKMKNCLLTNKNPTAELVDYEFAKVDKIQSGPVDTRKHSYMQKHLDLPVYFSKCEELIKLFPVKEIRDEFLMKIKDALIVEFSESNKGCVYIYRDGMPRYDWMAHCFRAKQLTGSVDELFKDSAFDYIKWYSSPKYGRLRHSTGWESSLSDWLQRELGINV